jgi:ATP-dependent DNA ligase
VAETHVLPLGAFEVKTLAELRVECDRWGIRVKPEGRVGKEPYIAALREYHWERDHPGESIPAQVMPMLLGSWEDLEEEEAEEIERDCHAWVVQPKLDGVRALLHVEGGRVRITSRTVSEVTYRLSELQYNLPQLTEGFAGLSGTILDGELVCPQSATDTGSTITGSPLQATMAILATTPENARRIQAREDRVRFHCFDALRYRGQDLTPIRWADRQQYVEEARRRSENRFVEAVPSFVVNKGEVHRRLVEAGGEGTVWKKADGTYQPGRRVGHWIKRKRGIEVEAVVSGFKPGNKGHASLVGAVEFSVPGAEGKSTPVAWVSNWSDAEREAMTHIDSAGICILNSAYMGRRALIAGQDCSAKSNRFRHARIVRWVQNHDRADQPSTLMG